ncbi:MAG: MFS transporter [Planctomycetaceae bacterium]|jgi:MFS transporter, FSR family, fosmidomycin resistance protein|nr:MFS transporter [Planctomycetaceae bacterium]MDC0274020.1 MFS transporter [Planctomycetaceae bacterium]MDC0308203.1 MFS transporter [Planctomycetaceae bacterium]MDG2389765.1 MFS transporter [Planctomycetaceae bacterium]
MPTHTFRLVLIVSCAHAMVHMFEHALPAVEQMIGDDFGVSKTQTGALGTAWRLPFGLGALLAGFLTDRFGSKRMLLIYLLGCMATSIGVWWAPSWSILFLMMLSMGTFASIYHPAALSLLSRETTPETRGKALGWHGIFGSLGIALAPFLASLVFASGTIGWQDYYLVLMIPAAVITVLLLKLKVTSEPPRTHAQRTLAKEAPKEPIPWQRFLILVAAGALSGFVYASFLHFLPRYLDQTGMRPEGWSAASFRNSLATVTLLCAAVGQGIAGRIADPEKLHRQLSVILLLNVPPLVWMAFADGPSRLLATCSLALIHFMNQPIYNSLIAELIPSSRRSTGYGFSNLMCFGIGAFGPGLTGMILEEQAMYLSLAGVAAASGVMSLFVWRTRAQTT